MGFVHCQRSIQNVPLFRKLSPLIKKPLEFDLAVDRVELQDEMNEIDELTTHSIKLDRLNAKPIIVQLTH